MFVAAMLIAGLVPAAAGAQRDGPLSNPALRVERLMQDYRTRPVKPVLDDLALFVKDKEKADAALRDWLERDRTDAQERADLRAALMLYSEAIMAIWASNDLTALAAASPYIPTLLRFHARLHAIDRRSPFLRGWYFLWEAFRQAFTHQPMPQTLDFLDEALDAFPGDPEILLAAGTRAELVWVTADANRHHDVRGASGPTDMYLVAARDYFRRALARDEAAFEVRLRLVRVLLALDDLDGAAKVASGAQWASSDPALAYLAALFEGTLRERQGDVSAAAAAYDRAIAQSSQPQSARLARAHLEYTIGSRAQAAAMVIFAMSTTSADNDPWWIYERGLVWHFEERLRRQRGMVRP